jgi:hypothetical protein
MLVLLNYVYLNILTLHNIPNLMPHVKFTYIIYT